MCFKTREELQGCQLTLPHYSSSPLQYSGSRWPVTISKGIRKLYFLSTPSNIMFANLFLHHSPGRPFLFLSRYPSSPHLPGPETSMLPLSSLPWFTEHSPYARHCTMHFICTISSNSHSKSMRQSLLCPFDKWRIWSLEVLPPPKGLT